MVTRPVTLHACCLLLALHCIACCLCCRCHRLLQVSDLYDPRTQWASYIINAIKAKELFVKDVNYIVKKDEVRRAACSPMA